MRLRVGRSKKVMRFVEGQHGTTKKLLLWDRFDSSFNIIDVKQQQEHKPISLQFPSPLHLCPLYKKLNVSAPQRHRSFNRALLQPAPSGAVCSATSGRFNTATLATTNEEAEEEAEEAQPDVCEQEQEKVAGSIGLI